MTQDNPAQVPPQSPQPAPTHKPAPTRPPNRRPRLWPLWLLCLLLVLGMAALGWLGWQGWQQLQQREATISQLQTSAQQQQSRVAELEQRYQERLNRLDQRAQEAVSEVQRLEQQMAKTSQQVLAMGVKTRTDWLMAEAEYLLRLANQRLLMERDPQGALAILQAADDVLRETDETAVYPVRQQIAEEIAALQNVAELDRTGIFLKLEALAGNVKNLQQRLEQELPKVELDAVREQSAASDWRGAAAELWRELKQLVVIRRTDEPVAPLLPPKEIFFLQQNLRLMLEQAQLALLEKNQALYDSSLEKAEAWVRRFFTTSEPGDNALAQRFLDNLEQLKSIQVNPDLPDISASLRQLKTLVDSLYEKRGSEAGGAQSPGSQSEQAQPERPQSGGAQPGQPSASPSGAQAEPSSQPPAHPNASSPSAARSDATRQGGAA